jgi:hypothetical protein
MMVTANQLYVSASNRPSSGSTSNENGLDVQPDDGLLEAKTCSWLIQYSCVLTLKRLLFNFVNLTNTTRMSHLKGTR